MTVVDVTEQDFQQQVIEASRQVPVVVDFWAAWCGPCRQLGPVLEREAAEREGEVVLAKVDTEAAPGLARQWGIQGIPAVKAFSGGAVVDEFVGALPPAQVRAFFDRLVPSEADQLVAAGDEQALRRAHELEPGRRDAATALAGLLLARGDEDGALALVDGIVGDPQAEAIAARVRLVRSGDDELAGAARELADGAPQAGVDRLIELLPSRPEAREDVRAAIVGALIPLGVEDPFARDARRRLASALF